MILTRTPLRVSLFGGGTDYPEWFTEHGGACLGMGINKYCYVGVKRMPPGQELAPGVPLRFRVQYSHVDNTNEAEAVKHPAVRAALKYLAIHEPLEFHTFGDLAGRSGLGGSSAFSVGLLHSLLRLLRPQEEISQLRIAKEAIAFERAAIPEAVGFQDQIFAALGGVRLLKFGAVSEVQPIAFWPKNRLQELESQLLLVFTGTMRDAHVMARKQVENIDQNRSALRAMAAMPEFARKILTSSQSLEDIGTMLHQAWIFKRSLHHEMASGSINDLYERGLGLGATGGKLLGAGGGGFMLFFVPPERQQRFFEGISAPVERFKADHEGTKVIVEEESK